MSLSLHAGQVLSCGRLIRLSSEVPVSLLPLLFYRDRKGPKFPCSCISRFHVRRDLHVEFRG